MGDEDEDDMGDSGDDDLLEANDEEKMGGGFKKGNRGPYPVVGKLAPKEIPVAKVGKYGNPENKKLWDWYVRKGHRDIHPDAHELTTASINTRRAGKKHSKLAQKFSSCQSRVNDASLRQDVEVTMSLGKAKCRLFIPEGQQAYFNTDKAGSLRLAPLGHGTVPFPVLIPSSGRSALDEQVGLLDLTGTMVDDNGCALGFVQIVAVRPSEVQNYRASAPFFTVMELPKTRTSRHPIYGKSRPEDLGVGCSRHWLMLLADALGMKHIFMLDDSVLGWRGVTLVGDPLSLFGREPNRKKASFDKIPLSRVLRHFADPNFLEHEMEQLSVLGFARMCPDLFTVRCAFRRAHVYSAFLVNVTRVLHEQNVNFNQDLYIWEDFDFNFAVRDSCKTYRFVMCKKPYAAGGCSEYIARSADPIKRCLDLTKMSCEDIVACSLQGALPALCYRDQIQEASVPDTACGRERRKKPKETQMTTTTVRDTRDLLEIEADAAFTVKGAVCDENGWLHEKYYKRFVQAFAEKEGVKAKDSSTHPYPNRPGVREGEEFGALRVWNDANKIIGAALRKKIKITVNWSDSWGAGWICDHPLQQDVKYKSRWFNIKTWGSWRLVYLLTRLQLRIWQERHPDAPPGRPRLGKAEALKRARVLCARWLKRDTPCKEKPPKMKKKGRPDGNSGALLSWLKSDHELAQFQRKAKLEHTVEQKSTEKRNELKRPKSEPRLAPLASVDVLSLLKGVKSECHVRTSVWRSGALLTDTKAEVADRLDVAPSGQPSVSDFFKVKGTRTVPTTPTIPPEEAATIRSTVCEETPPRKRTKEVGNDWPSGKKFRMSDLRVTE